MDIAGFIAKWQGITGGAERANYAQFINDFCRALDLPEPGVAEGGKLGDYQFEGPVAGGGAGGNTGAIDLYKRSHFILEAKQSKLTATQQLQPELFDTADSAPATPSGARYDRLMRDALAQAKRYAVNLPADHPWPPFLIVCDVGRAFELYFDWSGNGRGYGYFPDQQGYRFTIDRFNDADVCALFRALWTDPASIDPRFQSAEVTREIARRLADVSKWLEDVQRQKTKGQPDHLRSLAVEETALFLMRIIFCMFAEDVELLPKGRFTAFLEKATDNQAAFEPELHDLWQVMARADGKRYASAIGEDVRYFNGGLFDNSTTFPLSDSNRSELLIAATYNWSRVEPAIFGTLLEQALTASERAKLGAHYTPRPYVERLVQATIMDVLEAEWEAVIHPDVSSTVCPTPDIPNSVRPELVEGPPLSSNLTKEKDGASTGSARTGKGNAPPSILTGSARTDEEMVAATTAFHARLAALRILDPACGTGNFLYVAMENLMRLEGDVVETIRQLGGDAQPEVGPHQFLGLELNARAAVIAELVLWIGWLRWRMKNDPAAAPDPVLRRENNINFGTHGGYDAVLRRTATGEPDVDNPMQPDWPAADFIIGNPPFIGGKDIRRQLGGDYAEGLWKANPRVPKSADFVMQWWDRAAHILTAKDSRLIRFGFVTTNSITQTFSRRVFEKYLAKGEAAGGISGTVSSEVPSTESEAGETVPEMQRANPIKSSPERGGGSVGDADGGAGSRSGPDVEEDTTPAPPSLASRATPPRSGEDQDRLSLLLAIADHPWTRATRDAAAVRIAMTVAARGAGEGRLVEVTAESALDSDTPVLVTRERRGRVNADLKMGADVTAVVPLKANEGLSVRGIEMHADGYVIEQKVFDLWQSEAPQFFKKYVKRFIASDDLKRGINIRYVADFYDLDEKSLRQSAKTIYQHLLNTARHGRAKNSVRSRRELWWRLALPHSELRDLLDASTRYIGTIVTSKHRWFTMVSSELMPDQSIMVFGIEDFASLGVLSSTVHTTWALSAGGTLENRPRYNKSQIFDPFPFPDASLDQRAAIADLAEELDAARKAALAETPGLTMTEIYNWREKLRSGAVMNPADQDRAVAARAGIVGRLHEQIDAAVADAYGWGADHAAGVLTPAEITARLVALNAARAAEEAAGKVRWLRPDYQIPRFGTKKG